MNNLTQPNRVASVSSLSIAVNRRDEERREKRIENETVYQTRDEEEEKNND